MTRSEARVDASRVPCRMVIAVLALALASHGAAASTEVAHAAAAAPPELPGYVPGETFIFDNGRVEQVVAVDQDRVTWISPGSRPYVRHRNFLLPLLEWKTRDSEGRRRVAGSDRQPWPLAEGRTARFQVVTDATLRSAADRKPRQRRASELWDCRVGTARTLRVRAGAFEAWRVQCDRYSPRTMRVTRRDIWYYAPDVGHYVRRESVDLRSGRRTSFELAAALPARAANPRRIRAILAGL